MRMIPGVTALLLQVAVLIIMGFQTWTMVWASPPGEDSFVTTHRWFDLTILGYGNFLPLLSFLVTLVSALLQVGAVLQQRFSAAAMLLAGAVAVLLSFFGYNSMLAGYLSGAAVAIPVVLGVSVAIMLTEDTLHKRAAKSSG